jgi:HEAT repeat protein
MTSKVEGMKAQVLKQMTGPMARKSSVLGGLGMMGMSLLLASPSLAQSQLAEAQPGMAMVMAVPLQFVLEDLQSQDVRDRLRAVTALENVGEIGRTAVPQLIQLLDEQAGPEFVAANVRGAAAQALGNMGQAAEVSVPNLVMRLSDRQPEVRSAAVEALSKLGPGVARSLPQLMVLLKADDVGTQASAAEAVGNLGMASQGAIPDLLQLMKSGNSEVIASATQAIGKMGPAAKDAAPVLVQVLLDERSKPLTKGYAAAALGNLGEAGRVAIPYLTTASKNLDSDLRDRATQALRKLR